MIGRYLPTSFLASGAGWKGRRPSRSQPANGSSPQWNWQEQPYNLIATDNALANAEADADRFHYVVAIGMRIIKAFAWMHQQLQKMKRSSMHLATILTAPP